MVAKKDKNKKISVKPAKKQVNKTEVKSHPKFLYDVEFNLHVIIYLFGINIILICVVLFYVTQLQVLTQKESDLKDQMKYDDFTYYKYNLDEFSNFAKKRITSAKELEKYALEENFDLILRKGGSFYGEKEGTCFNDLTREERRCKKGIIEYDESDPNKFEIYIVREFQFGINN